LSRSSKTGNRRIRYPGAMSGRTTPLADDAQARAARWLEAWDAQGVHRTGTIGGTASAAWLAREVSALGAELAVEEYRFGRLDPVECFIELNDKQIEAVPVFDAPPTDGRGVVGRLGQVGGDAEIGVAELSPRAVYTGEFERIRRESCHRALVVLCAGDAPGLALLNAEHFTQPYGAPALHISSTERAAIVEAIAQRRSARFVSFSRRTPGHAFNLVVTLPGTDQPQSRLVVMTPRSSWWQSAAERGGGLVCWLESLRALIAAPPAGPVVFTANSGHELGHLGLHDFLARRPGWDRPPEQGGAVWLHYGANIGAADGTLSLMSNDDPMRKLATDELARAGQPPDSIAPKTAVPSGETRDIHRAGGRYLTFVGTNPLFHLPQDRWPHAVDLGVLTRAAAAAARITLTLTR
jgi:hypothetical protein